MLFESCGYYMVLFFFKQKTAYEMRISDWSSDVCSSDLNDRLGRGIVPAFGRRFLIMPFIGAAVGVERDDRGQEPVVALAVRARPVVPRIAVADAQIDLVEILVIDDGVPHREIGRAHV